MIKKRHHRKKIAFGIVAAALIGAYFLSGARGTKNRARLKNWAISFRRDVMRELRKAKKLDARVYQAILKKLHVRYKKFETVDKKKLAGMVKDMKRHWKRIRLHQE